MSFAASLLQYRSKPVGEAIDHVVSKIYQIFRACGPRVDNENNHIFDNLGDTGGQRMGIGGWGKHQIKPLGDTTYTQMASTSPFWCTIKGYFQGSSLKLHLAIRLLKDTYKMPQTRLFRTWTLVTIFVQKWDS